MQEPALFDALVHATGSEDEARKWMTETLVNVYPAGAIDAIQWDGEAFLPRWRLRAKQEKARKEGDTRIRQTWSITGKGIVAELRRARQRNDTDLINALAAAIGKPAQKEAA